MVACMHRRSLCETILYITLICNLITYVCIIRMKTIDVKNVTDNNAYNSIELSCVCMSF